MTPGTAFQTAVRSQFEIRNDYNAALSAIECGYKAASHEELVALWDDLTVKGQALLDSGLFPDWTMQNLQDEIRTMTPRIVAMIADHKIAALQEQVDALQQQMETIRTTTTAQLKATSAPFPG